MSHAALECPDIVESILKKLDGPSTLFALRVSHEWGRALRLIHGADMALFEGCSSPERYYLRWPLYADGNIRLLKELGDDFCEASLWRVAVQGNLDFFKECFQRWPRVLAHLQQGWTCAEPGSIVDPVRAYFLECSLSLRNRWVYRPVHRARAVLPPGLVDGSGHTGEGLRN